MILKSQSIEYKLDSNGKDLGTMLVSKNIKDTSVYKYPFMSPNKKLEVVKIGSGNYNDFDSFIIASLNDYFNKLSNPSDLETKEGMLDKYTKLYNLWSIICEKKETNDVASLQKYYDKISYGLYQLGYNDGGL